MKQKAPDTVDRLLAAIHQSGDFPGMAKTIESISVLTASEGTSCATLADTILQDYGLTQKVLRMVNTVAYAQREPVTTVTRAVILMGFERIRDIAAGLLVFEHLQKQARTAPLADALTMSFFSAAFARNVAEHTAAFNGEEAFISALFHRLGKLLVAFYLPQDYGVIGTVEHRQQDTKAREVLGLSFQQIGAVIGDELKLPQRLIDCMERIPGADSRRSLTPSERMACLSTLANDATDVLASPGDPLRKRAAVQRLLDSYNKQFTITWTLEDLVAKSVRDLEEASAGFDLHVAGAQFLAGVAEWQAAIVVSDGTAAAGSPESSAAGQRSPTEPAPEAAESPETVLTTGLLEITSLLATDFSLDDVLGMVLETVYRALGVGRVRVFLLLVDPAASVARFRVGFGHTPGDLGPWAEIPFKGSEDLFSLAITQQKDLVIRDARTAQVAQALPRWFTKGGVPDRFMVLLPLVVNQKTVGLIYVDGQKEQGSTLTPAVLNFVKVLRGQAVLAISQIAARARR